MTFGGKKFEKTIEFQGLYGVFITRMGIVQKATVRFGNDEVGGPNPPSSSKKDFTFVRSFFVCPFYD